jgi:uroporphyrinogen-III decarboxylase
MYDEPELVHDAMSLISETYTKFMNEWYALHPASDVMNTHWGAFYHRGKIVLRSDSAMNLSPELYSEFSLPYDKLLLDRFDGGVVHFCGRGDHYIDLLCAEKGVTGINLSQPEYNDMEKIYANTLDKGIKIFSIQRSRAEADKGRGFGGNLHCHNLK